MYFTLDEVKEKMKLGQDYHIENAFIEGVMLGIEDHGILTMSFHLKYDGTAQSYGGICLDERGTHYERQSGPAVGMMIRSLCEIFSRDFMELSGYCRVIREDSHWNSRIKAIGHILNDRWFSYELWVKAEKDDAGC